jgi:hypothetical protein
MLVHVCMMRNDLCLLCDSGSRIDVVRTKIMAVSAQSQCAICSFDFAGCGLSDGAHVCLLHKLRY